MEGNARQVDVRSMSNRSKVSMHNDRVLCDNGAKHIDVDDHSIWSTTMPANKKDIKFIAVDVTRLIKAMILY